MSSVSIQNLFALIKSIDAITFAMYMTTLGMQLMFFGLLHHMKSIAKSLDKISASLDVNDNNNNNDNEENV